MSKKPVVTAVLVITFSDGMIGRGQFYGEPTDANIQRELDRTRFPDPDNPRVFRTVASWRRCRLQDFPKGSVKPIWRDRDGQIVESSSVTPQKK
jgi:hypothetical protein